jgi:hypothetical protein
MRIIRRAPFTLKNQNAPVDDKPRRRRAWTTSAADAVEPRPYPIHRKHGCAEGKIFLSTPVTFGRGAANINKGRIAYGNRLENLAAKPSSRD